MEKIGIEYLGDEERRWNIGNSYYFKERIKAINLHEKITGNHNILKMYYMLHGWHEIMFHSFKNIDLRKRYGNLTFKELIFN